MSNIEFQNWGDMSEFLTRPVDRTKPVLGDFFWMDRNKWYLIFTGGPMEKGRPYTHMRRKKEDPAPNADPNMVELTILKPITVDIHYRTHDQINRHNTCHQESLDIERKVEY